MPDQEKIRVLIVDDIAETRENIRRLLQFDLNIDVVGAARSGNEAIELSQEIKPDVVIMDINMPDMDGITATEAIRRKLPYVQVIILSVQSDPSYMRRAMLAGARDFLTKPPSMDELTAAIGRAGKMAQDERAKVSKAFPTDKLAASQIMPGLVPSLGKVIVVYSPKGGAGCTTIATNLSLALQQSQKKVALIDGSLQFGDVAVFLNEQVKNTVLDLAPRVDELDHEVIQDVMFLHNASGLRFLASPPRPELAEKVIGEQFGKLLQFLREMFSHIVVDTSSYLSDAVQAALEIADAIILITTQDIPSIKNASAFLTLSDASGIKRDQIIFVMNRYDKKITITPERVGQSLKQDVALTIPIDDKLAGSSINRGVPFVLDNKNHPLSKSIFALAGLILDRLAKLESPHAVSAAKK